MLGGFSFELSWKRAFLKHPTEHAVFNFTAHHVYICGRTTSQMDQTNGNSWRFNINWPAEGGGGLCCCRSGAGWCQDRPAGTYHTTPPSPFLRRLACRNIPQPYHPLPIPVSIEEDDMVWLGVQSTPGKLVYAGTYHITTPSPITELLQDDMAWLDHNT